MTQALGLSPCGAAACGDTLLFRSKAPQNPVYRIWSRAAQNAPANFLKGLNYRQMRRIVESCGFLPYHHGSFVRRLLRRGLW